MKDANDIIIELIHQRSVAFDEARDARNKLDIAINALKHIAAIKYGLEINDTDRTMKKYFAKQCASYQRLASETLVKIQRIKND